MRTTLTLDDDVAAAVRRRFRQRTANLGLGVDVRNVAEALELLDGPGER